MRQTDWTEWSDDDLLANAAAQAERWERIVLAGAAHKGADRPDRGRKRKSHSGPDREYGRMDESKTRSYEYTEAHGDMLMLEVRGHERMVADSEPMQADWYGDAYGTGRHYSHIEDMQYVEPVSRGMGQSARTGKGKTLILSPTGEHSMVVTVLCPDCLCGEPLTVRFDYPVKPSAYVPTGRKRGRPRKSVKIDPSERLDDSSLFHDGTSQPIQWQKPGE